MNKPGCEVDDLKGGVAGGSILKGVLKVSGKQKILDSTDIILAATCKNLHSSSVLEFSPASVSKLDLEMEMFILNFKSWWIFDRFLSFLPIGLILASVEIDLRHGVHHNTHFYEAVLAPKSIKEALFTAI